MTQTASWINVLNEETQWKNRADMTNWLAAIFGNNQKFSPPDLDRFDEDIILMRQTIHSLHFGGGPDLLWLDKRLASVKLTVRYESFLSKSARGFWPLLHAQVHANNGQDLLKALAQTLLVQFAEFITTALDGAQGPSIARCEGLFRESGNPHPTLSMVRSIPEDSELAWREEIEIIRQNDLTTTAAVQRCADIFIAAPKARFCSDACRFTTFQLMKQLKDPRYHAEKQKKYRSKLAEKD